MEHAANLNYRISNKMQALSQEQWDFYKEQYEKTLPLLDEMAANRSVADRTAEEIALAADDTKTQHAIARRNTTRALERSRNPSDPGYGAVLAESYGNEAADVSRAITAARRAERARGEDVYWGRTLNTVGAMQRLPQDGTALLTASSQAAARGGQLAGDAGRLRSQSAGQLAYGATALGTTALNRWFRPGGQQPGGYAPGYDPYGGGPSVESGDAYVSPDFQPYDAGAMDGVYLKDGGAVRARPRRYADGGVPVINNPDGTISTERTATFEVDGRHIVLPTIVNGQQLTSDQAFKLWQDGKHRAVGVFQSAEEADEFARQRSAAGGALQDRKYAAGGPVKGPGTGTSDSIKATVRPDSYILSADTVRAIGTKKIKDLVEKAGVRPDSQGGDDVHGIQVRLSNGEYHVPPEATRYYGEEFFNKMQQKYHKPVASADGMANGGAIRGRRLPVTIENAIMGNMPRQAISSGRR